MPFDSISLRASFKSRLFLTAARNLAIAGTRASTIARVRPSGPVLEDPVGNADAGIRKIIRDSTGDGQG
jgi:hypothetical protein